MNVKVIQEALRKFAADRDWEKFHSPKNLATALTVEAGELLEHFQWLTDEESRQLPSRNDELEAVRDEIADVLIYLLRLADLLEVDLESSVAEKMRKNAEKYPVDLSKGSAVKYNRRR